MVDKLVYAHQLWEGDNTFLWSKTSCETISGPRRESTYIKIIAVLLYIVPFSFIFTTGHELSKYYHQQQTIIYAINLIIFVIAINAAVNALKAHMTDPGYVPRRDIILRGGAQMGLLARLYQPFAPENAKFPYYQTFSSSEQQPMQSAIPRAGFFFLPHLITSLFNKSTTPADNNNSTSLVTTSRPLSAETPIQRMENYAWQTNNNNNNNLMHNIKNTHDENNNNNNNSIHDKYMHNNNNDNNHNSMYNKNMHDGNNDNSANNDNNIMHNIKNMHDGSNDNSVFCGSSDSSSLMSLGAYEYSESTSTHYKQIDPSEIYPGYYPPNKLLPITPVLSQRQPIEAVSHLSQSPPHPDDDDGVVLKSKRYNDGRTVTIRRFADGSVMKYTETPQPDPSSIGKDVSSSAYFLSSSDAVRYYCGLGVNDHLGPPCSTVSRKDLSHARSMMDFGSFHQMSISSVPLILRPKSTFYLNNNNNNNNLRWCRTCMIMRTPTVSHCAVCDNCVLDFDHHCGVIGNCIGARNHPHFYRFLAFTTIVLTAMIVQSALLIVLQVAYPSYFRLDGSEAFYPPPGDGSTQQQLAAERLEFLVNIGLFSMVLGTFLICLNKVASTCVYHFEDRCCCCFLLGGCGFLLGCMMAVLGGCMGLVCVYMRGGYLDVYSVIVLMGAVWGLSWVGSVFIEQTVVLYQGLNFKQAAVARTWRRSMVEGGEGVVVELGLVGGFGDDGKKTREPEKIAEGGVVGVCKFLWKTQVPSSLFRYRWDTEKF